jgi:hypothetical protein
MRTKFAVKIRALSKVAKTSVAVALMGSLTLASEPVPSASTATGMFDLYRLNRTLQRPNYITEDFLLLSYSMLLRDAIADHEQTVDYPGFVNAVQSLESRARRAKSSDAVSANLKLLMVLDEILTNPDAGTPPLTRVSRGNDGVGPIYFLKALIAPELEKIRAAAGVSKSHILLQNIDYSQFRPRGHYTRSPELSRYFTAVRYAGTALFYVKGSAATGVDSAAADRLTRQALLLAQWIHADREVSEWFDRYEARTGWLFGPAEDLQRQDLLKAASPFPTGNVSALRKRLLERARKEGRQPAIFGVPVDVSRLEQGVTAADALTGWRLLPQSFTPDSAAGQMLVYGNVGKYLGTAKPLSLTYVNGAPVKGFPLANEMMALLGSKEADAQLKTADETNYEGYGKAWQEAGKQMSRPAGLASEQLELLRAWFSQKDGDGAVKLAAARGFWTWDRHESVLYVKQSYTGVGKGLQPADSRTSAWLEPSAELYRGLRKISGELQTRLESKSFGKFSEILDRCIAIATAEQANGSPSPADAEFLNNLDLDLAELVAGPEKPIAVDVHTDVNSGQVLIEALGFPRIVDRKDARGVRFNPEEFKHPLADRLTDEKWLEMLQERGK